MPAGTGVLSNANLSTQMTAQAALDATPTQVNLTIRFVGVKFQPSDLFTALSAANWNGSARTLESDCAQVGHNTYDLVISS